MPYHRAGVGLYATLIAAILLGTAGCGGDSAGDKPEFTKLGALARLYGQYRVKSRGQLPGSEEDLRQFAAGEGAVILEQVGVSNFDELLLSERDGQPVVLLFGEDLAGQRQSPPIVAHEKEGIDGERIVVLGAGMAETLTDEEFNSWIGTGDR